MEAILLRAKLRGCVRDRAQVRSPAFSVKKRQVPGCPVLQFLYTTRRGVSPCCHAPPLHRVSFLNSSLHFPYDSLDLGFTVILYLYLFCYFVAPASPQLLCIGGQF